MPAIVDKYIIDNEKYDRRVKLTDEEREEIYNVYKDGLFSQRELATLFNVSRRTIQFIIAPEKLAENKLRRAERGGSKQYYNTQANTVAQNEHRKYKEILLDTGVKLHQVA